MRRLFKNCIHWLTGSKQKHASQRRNHNRGRLRCESLESRQLLAGDFLHNEAIPEDVNDDGIVSAVDVLNVINEINVERRGGQTGQGEAGGRRMMTDVNNDGLQSPSDVLAVINRINRDRNRRDGDNNNSNRDRQDDNNQTEEVRSIDGTGNNEDNPELGSAGTQLLRVADADYADGISEPGGEDRPSAREISNALFAADPEGAVSERDLSAFVFMWGQFLDHDIDLSVESETHESFDIEVPQGDPFFDPFNTGEVTIPLVRSATDPLTGTDVDNPAQQVNVITSWIDGSQVYGSDQETADALRSFVGGRMLITEDGLLPTNDLGQLLAGDIRAAENIALTSMHALFLREHNRIADQLAESNPEMSDEELYQAARSRVIAQLQSITFNEFLPALLGRNAIAEYRGYDATVDPSIANEFSTAAFRFGHSTLSDELGFMTDEGLEAATDIALSEAFFNPSILEETGIDSVLKHGASVLSQEVDLQVVDSLRNFLFGPPGAGGLDLVSLNIQRGRDHGLSDFNSTRVAYGLEAYESFDEITSNEEVQQQLEELYGDVNNIDLWVGILAEDHTSRGSLGPTATAIIADQFERLRDGDRFWYQNTLNGRELERLENTSLADIIERNTNLNSLQDDVFFFSPVVAGMVMPSQNTTAEGEDSRGRNDRNPDMSGFEVQLLDADGNVVDSDVTSHDGSYRFADISEAGQYQIQMVGVDDAEPIEILISSGDSVIRGMNFVV